MAENWPQLLLQPILIGLILSFLIAKLISFITRDKTELTELTEKGTTSTSRHVRKHSVKSETDSISDVSEVDNTSVLAEKGSVDHDHDDYGDDDDDDDWEGVESTELDELFSAATAFVAVDAAVDAAVKVKVGSDLQLQLYGLYKIATEGPCSGPAPPAYKITARSKWNAWQKLGAMPPEDAMQKYIDIVTELFPSWASGGADKSKGRDAEGHSSESKGPMGPVFSSFIHEEESGVELKMDAVHAYAREGDLENLLKCIETESSVNLKDSEGRTPLHWAVDRGHLPIIDLLCTKDADINAKDIEGQTPLHYAVVCDREAIAEYLVKHNADTNIKDNEGVSPSELCEKNWPWMRSTGEVVE